MPFKLGIRPSTASRQSAVAEVAARKQGVVAYWELIEIGFSAAAVQRWVAGGRLHRLYPGVYAVGHRGITGEGRCMAAVRACGPGAVLSHHSAAALWGLRPSSSPSIHVTTAGRRRPRGIKVHHVRQLHPDDVAECDAIPVTSVARTLLDLAEVLPMRQLIRAIEQAERLHLFDLRAIHALMARSFGRHGTKPLQSALAQTTGEPPRVNSDWERDFLDFCADHCLPRPELNVLVEGCEVDALWRDRKLIVELDSYAFHRSRSAFENDRLEDGVLQLADYRVLRITWRRLTEEPAAVAETLSAAIAAR